jgi:glycosyltransferase involved in cell wall biosynthesis
VLDVLEISGPVTGEKLAAHARQLAASGMVMATSRRLLDEARRVRPDAVLVPNACDPAHFAPHERRVVPAELAALRAAGTPIAGYYGALAPWVDYDLLDAVARRLVHWSFVLIGPDYEGAAARVPARPNVRWLGLRDYATLPAYLQGFDVAMIPFVINEITRATSPVKLFEYMAGDRPIVTTPLPEASDYGSVAIADGPDAFAAALEQAYARRHDAQLRRVRMTERDANTWASRAAIIMDAVATREARPRDVAVVLARMMIDETGGGHRPGQLTLELLRRGWRVVYVHAAETSSQPAPGATVSDPLLETCALGEFDVGDYVEPAAAGHRLLVLVESPQPAFEATLRVLRARGARVAYDLSSDWEGGDGGRWYDARVEGRIVAASDVLMATSPMLAEGLTARTGRAVMLIPNAVDGELFDPGRAHARPADLPAGRPQIVYVGSLSDRRFDWELVRQVAEAYPRAAITLIGDYRGQCPYMPPGNLFFLGLKPHREVPRYLAHADVGLLPFVVTTSPRAISHLKMFEYLAMGVRVVATQFVEREGLLGMHVAADPEKFVAAVGQAAEEPVDRAAIAAFTEANSWQARVGALEAAVFSDGSE